MLKPYRRSKRNIDVELDTEKLGDKHTYQEYAKTRNQVKSTIRKEKAIMEKEIAEMLRATQDFFWKYANSKRKTNTSISELKFKSEEGEERKTTTDKEKAEVLASFFSSVFTWYIFVVLPH
jgi:altronate dehydratase